MDLVFFPTVPVFYLYVLLIYERTVYSTEEFKRFLLSSNGLKHSFTQVLTFHDIESLLLRIGS